MFEITFVALELCYTAVWLVCRIVVWIRQRRIAWKREAALLLMYLNFAVILRFTFFPLALADGHVRPLVFDAAKAYPFRLHLLPLAELVRYGSPRDHLWNVGGNIALFIPSGILLPLLYKKLNGFWKTVAAGAAISLCIELFQLPFASRHRYRRSDPERRRRHARLRDLCALPRRKKAITLETYAPQKQRADRMIGSLLCYSIHHAHSFSARRDLA